MTPRRSRASRAARAHKWALGAFPSLIDAAHSRRGVWIDALQARGGEPFLVIRDRGPGLTRAQLLARTAVPPPVRHWQRADVYACPWQAAAFRLGADVTILTRTRHACFAALLSRARIADLRDPDSEPASIVMQWHHSVSERHPHAAALCTYSPWQTARELSDAFNSIAPTGTLVAISSLKRDLHQAELELDIDTDPFDIRLSAHPHTQNHQFISSIRLSHSLRSYLEMLYLDPTFRIYLRNRIVRERRLSASMFARQDFVYNYTPAAPSGAASAPPTNTLVFRLGFDHGAHENEYGMLMYHKKRLVKPYLKLGFQIQPRNQIRVVAIVEADHLEPAPNMQAFKEDQAYQDLVFALGQSLKMFWAPYGSMTSVYRTHCNDPMFTWVRCDVCDRWRQLNPNAGRPPDTSCALWTCEMNTGGTIVCNEPDDVGHQQVPVRVLTQRPTSTISSPFEDRKRSGSLHSPLESQVKRPRHPAMIEPSLMRTEPARENEAHASTSPVPLLQSPVGLDNCSPELIVSDGAELRTDPFSLNENDSPLTESTSSPGNVLEKAARAKPLPGTVRHDDIHIKCLDAPVLPSDITKPLDVNSASGDGENIFKACDLEERDAAVEGNQFMESAHLAATPPLGERTRTENLGTPTRSNPLEKCQVETKDLKQPTRGGENTNPAALLMTRVELHNATTHCSKPCDAHRLPVTVPLVREVVVHHTSKFTRSKNRTSVVQVHHDTGDKISDEVVLASIGRAGPSASDNPGPYDAQACPSASADQVGSAIQRTDKAAKDLVLNAPVLRNGRFDGSCAETRSERDREEEAIKVLENLGTRKHRGGETDPGKDMKAEFRGPEEDDTGRDRCLPMQAVTDLNGVTSLQHVAASAVDDCGDGRRRFRDLFGEQSKPTTPAQNLLKTPPSALRRVRQEGLAGNFGSMPGMPSPNTANPFLDVNAAGVFEPAPLNGVDVSNDFLDLGEVDGRLRTPSQRKHTSKTTLPLQSDSRIGLDTTNETLNQLLPTDRAISEAGKPTNGHVMGEQAINLNASGVDDMPKPRRNCDHSCFGNGVLSRHRSGDKSLSRRCSQAEHDENEFTGLGSREREPSETLKVSDISSMIPWSQIAATAAAAGAAAAAAAVQDRGGQNQPTFPTGRQPVDEVVAIRASQESMEELREELKVQKNLAETYKEKLQELVCLLAPAVAGRMTKLIRNPLEIDVPQLSRDILTSVSEKTKEEADTEHLQALQSCRASEQIACSSLEKLRGLVRTFLEETVGLRTQNEQDKPIDRHFEEYLNALDVFPS